MPKIQLSITDLEEESQKSPAVDVVASATRKSIHRPFGQMMKALANVVKTALGGDTSNWNRKWTLATKTFSELWSGKNPVDVRPVMIAMGTRELKLDAKTAISVVDAVINNFGSIASQEGVWASKQYRGRAGISAPSAGAGAGGGGLGTATV